MKNINVKIILLAIIPFLFLGSCNNDDDGYASGKWWESLATVYPENNTYYLVLDNGSKLGVVASDVNYRPKANQRVYVNYTLLSDSANGFKHLVKINWLSEILTKGIINLTFENQDSIGNDPIKIHSLWIGDDYLNIFFGYNTGGQSVHYINLVNNTIPDPNPIDEKIRLEFRHNANNTPEWYGRKGYVAFDLRPYKTTENEFVDFVISSRDFNGEYKNYDIRYNFNNKTTDIRTSLTYDSDINTTLF